MHRGDEVLNFLVYIWSIIFLWMLNSLAAILDLFHASNRMIHISRYSKEKIHMKVLRAISSAYHDRKFLRAGNNSHLILSQFFYA